MLNPTTPIPGDPSPVHLDRRTAVVSLAAVGAGVLGIAASAAARDDATAPAPTPAPGFEPLTAGWDAAKGEYILPKLAFAFEALIPHIDAGTMEIHHDRHHQAYVNGANTALKELAALREAEKQSGPLTKHWMRELSFHLGGHINHTLFWQMLKPQSDGGGGFPTGDLAARIQRDFGTYDKFANQFRAAAVNVEGSGWAWLALEPVSKRLVVVQMEKQQDLLFTGVRPILGIDMWEHAYYLQYQNVRNDYFTAVMNVINWDFASQMLAHAMR